MEPAIRQTGFGDVEALAETLPHEAGEAAIGDDPLLACLAFVARALGKPFSRAGVLSALPLRNDRLTVDLLPRAAARLGLNARLVQRRLRSVPGLVVPYIVLFESGDAAVVVRKQRRGRKLTVVFPAVSEERRTISGGALEHEASGYLFYIAADVAGTDRPEEREAGRRKGHWFWPAVRRFWPSWMQIVVAALVINVLGLALPLFLMNVYDPVIPNLAIPTLWVLATGVVVALFFDFLLKQLRAVVLDRTGRRVDMSVAASLFEHALGISMAERSASSGAVANQIREFESVRDFFTSSSIIALTDLLFIGVFIAVLWLIVGPLAYVPLVAVPLVLFATLLIQIPLACAVDLTQAQASRRHGILVEGLIGVETIKAVAGEGVMQRRWEDAVAGAARANSTTRFWSSTAVYFTGFVQQSVSVVMIVWGVFLVAEGEISIGGLIAANILAGRVLAPLGNIAMTLVRAQQAFASMRGITRFMSLGREGDGAVADGRRVTAGEIEFRDVTFAYPGGSADALKGVSFRIAAGERVGVIGPIGSGKTTMGKLIAGLYHADRGAVLADGVNVQRYAPADLRAGVCYVAQDTELFAGTVRDNIVLGKPEASEEEIARAVRVAGVDAFTDSHPLGLGLPVGERGRGLSGGQRQAVGLARMLLRRPRVLFLDEPASAMDMSTEADLVRNLQSPRAGVETLIVCTHRTSLLELADRLLVLDGGRIVADGPKAAVLKALRGDGRKRGGTNEQ